MSDSPQPTQPQAEIVHALCREAEALIGRLEGPLRSVTIEAGDCLVKVEWRGGAPAAPEPLPAPSPATTQVVAESDGGRLPVLAPLVGTFYRCPEPGAPPFVEEGDLVETNQPVGIIEAMKIMNSITAPGAGRILEIAVRDGEMVEFEQVLMYIEAVEGAD
jgi:acetyl-CoA carboxylase biotin carboxyl carrier protein